MGLNITRIKANIAEQISVDSKRKEIFEDVKNIADCVTGLSMEATALGIKAADLVL